MTTSNEPCKCGAMGHAGTSRHTNKEIPHFHRTDKDGNSYIDTAHGKLTPIETSAIEQIMEEHRQLEMFDVNPEEFKDLQDGDMVEES